MLDNLTELATQFRQMIENADRSNLTVEFKNFPFGSCGDASILLAQYLTDSGYETPIYVSGQLVEPTGLPGHAWLELDGVIIDITADGFEPHMPKVVVAENSDWHNQFDRLDEHPAAIHGYDDYTASRLVAAYQELTE